MQCKRCPAQITAEDSYEYAGEILCENCYMDALSPTRTCDPWAVYTAKHAPDKGPANPAQHKIMDLLEKQGQVNAEVVMGETGLTRKELEREVATLRHMELLRAVRRDDGGIAFVPFSQ